MLLLVSLQFTAILNQFSSPNLLFTEMNLFMYFEAFFSPFGSSFNGKTSTTGEFIQHFMLVSNGYGRIDRTKSYGQYAGPSTTRAITHKLQHILLFDSKYQESTTYGMVEGELGRYGGSAATRNQNEGKTPILIARH